jgi:hypothetical protein
MAKPLLSLSTALKDTIKFSVDGVGYEILGVDHLTPDDEAEVMALFARYGNIQMELDGEKNVSKGIPKALELRGTRLRLLVKMTTMPAEVAAKLPLTQQVQLLEAIQEEGEADDDAAPAAIEPEPGELIPT